MIEVEFVKVEPSMEWAEQFIMKSKKLALEYEPVMKKQIGDVFVFLLKRKGMKYEYAIVRVSVLRNEGVVLYNVMMLDKAMISEICKYVGGEEGV